MALYLIFSAEILFAQDDLLVTRPFQNRVDRYDGFSGEFLGTFIQSGAGGLIRPGDVTVGPDQNLYVTSGSNQVLRYDGVDGTFIDVFASGAGLSTPNSLNFYGEHLYVGNFVGNGMGSVSRFDAVTGEFDSNFIEVDFVDGFVLNDDSIYVSNFSGGVDRFDTQTGDFIENFVDPGEGGLANPTALLFTSDNELLVSSYSTNSVKRYSSDGQYIDDVITNLTNPEGLEYGLDGNLYAGSYSTGVINQYDPSSYSFLSEFVNAGPVSNFFTFRTSAVPEPSSAVCIAIGLLAFCGRGQRNRRPTKHGRIAAN